MTINEYVKQWCDEEYDVRKEDFYVENAFYVADREWARGGLKHGVFALIASLILPAIGNSGILGNLMTLGALTVCFWLYAIREYDANSPVTSRGLYIMTLIALRIAMNFTPIWTYWLFACSTLVLYVYLTVLRPIKFAAVAAKMKKRILQEEAEEDAADKRAYAQWEAGFKSERYGLPPGNNQTTRDPLMDEARKLFNGYTENKQVLKSRYRQLMKVHHPDRGGDERLCQCIVAVYEDLNKMAV